MFRDLRVAFVSLLRLSFVLLIFLLLSSISFLGYVSAQTSTQWNLVYGLHGSGRCVINTEDGGYAIAGDADGQFLFLKVDSSGNVQWETTYGNGTATAIIETGDGGYALAGTGDIFNFVKTGSQGELQWRRNFNNYGVTFRIESLIQASD